MVFHSDRPASADWRQTDRAETSQHLDEGLRAHMIGIYNWMMSGLLLTGIVAYLVANTSLSEVFFATVRNAAGQAQTAPTLLGWLAILSPLAFVLVLSFGISRLSLFAAQGIFWAFAAAMGVSMASLLKLYTGASVASAFFATAAMFAAMSLWGYTTKRDLTRMGSFLMMALIGLIVVGLLNLVLLQSGALATLFSIGAVIVFTLMTAWDTQRIRAGYLAGDFVGDSGAKASLMDALGLYLNFVNIFQSLLSLTGERTSD